MSVKISRLGQDQVVPVWPLLQKQIRRALKKSCGDRMTELGLLKALQVGRYEAFVAHTSDDPGSICGVCVFGFERRHDAGLAMVVVMTCGDYLKHSRWTEKMHQHLVDYMKQAGAYCIEAYCRDGISEILKNYGWRRKATLMEIR